MSTTQLEDVITIPNVDRVDGQPLAQQENQHNDCKSDHWQPDNIPNDCRLKQKDIEVSDERIKISVTEIPKIEKCAVANRGHSNNQKLSFRPPQQGGLSKKLWNKPSKARLKYYQQSIKADMENLQNLKNQTAHRKQHPPKNIKQNYNKMICNRTAQFSIRSKFFLPDKRPRKEVIIPPTKFLLGGNISDPLNLNSLQDEALNPTPNQTPRQSPITTPPKVEVIIPPNIYDPLHLLDPVDSIEYEKQLVSPMKRKSKSKHRNRKKKPRRKRIIDSISDTSAVSTSTIMMSSTTPVTTSAETARNISGASSTTTASASEMLQTASSSFSGDTSGELSDIHTDVEEKSYDCGAGHDTSGAAIDGRVSCCRSNQKENNNEFALKSMIVNSNSLAVRRNTDREKVTRDLRLDLNEIGGCEQQQIVIGGGRKRRISEGPNSMKNKFRRMDSMDKIVSPVVPQPGAWKRPPRTVPTGARKGSRLRSTSVSETELISPTDETKTIECTPESIRGDTPDIDAEKHLPEGGVAVDISTEVQSTQHQQQQSKSQSIPKFKPDGARFQYGNYERYSGYRNLNETMDVRLKVFHRHAHLFRGKDIIDIGCNVGHMTMAVAKDLMPNSILGLDIDRKLIMRARKNLSLFVNIPKFAIDSKRNAVATSSAVSAVSNTGTTDVRSVTAIIDNGSTTDINTATIADTTISATTTADAAAATITTPTVSNEVCVEPSKTTKDDNETDNKLQSKRNLNAKRKPYQKPKIDKERNEFFPISFPITYGGIPDLSSYIRSKGDLSPSYKSDQDTHFPKNVFFRAANYVLKDESLINNETQQYDVILCLSVTKWIHLNFGDIGLKQAFKRMFNQLRPGGKLILEAQNWASYKKKKNLTETIYNNYRNIEFFPNKFHEYLLGNEVGFSHSYCLGVPRHMNKGFCRPIQLYAKGDYTPNHIRWSDNYHPQTPYEAYRGKYAGMARPPHPLWGGYDTPHGNSGTYSCRQTPIYQGLSTSQYYNPLETDSYLPSYDTEIQNRHYVFASPLYQTVWSPPANLRNSSNQTPAFGSIREIDTEDASSGGPISRHVYPPNDCGSSPQAGVDDITFNSIREPNSEENSQQAQPTKQHVYANCDSSSSPKVDNSSSPIANRSNSSSRNPEQSDSVDDTETESLVNADIDGN